MNTLSRLLRPPRRRHRPLRPTCALEPLEPREVLSTLGPGFSVSAVSGLSTSEYRTSASFTVVLTAPPQAPVVVPVASADTTEGTVAISSLTFTTSNWNVPQRIVVTGVDDTIRDGNIAYRVRLAPAQSADPRYAGLDPADVTLVNVDNEPRFGLAAATPASTAARSGSSTVEVLLPWSPQLPAPDLTLTAKTVATITRLQP